MSRLRRPERRASDWAHPFWTPLHVSAWVGLGLSQPLLDLVARHPSFLAAHALSGAEVWGLALGVAWIPATLAALPAAVALFRRRRPGRPARAVAGVCLGLSMALVGLGLASRVVSTLAAAAPIALGVAGLGLALHLRSDGFRFLTSVLAAVLVVAPAVFLASDSARLRWLPQEPYVPPPAERPQPVYIVLFDQFPGWTLMTPDFEIDAERFPHFAALARTADYYPVAHSSAPMTDQSVPSFLSGVHMLDDVDQRSADCSYLRQLTTSFDTNFQELVTDLAPDDEKRSDARFDPRQLPRDLAWIYLHWLLPQAVHPSLPSIQDRWAGFGADADLERSLENAAARRGELAGPEERADDVTDLTVPRFGRFLRSLGEAADGRPPFVFHHSAVPHPPWRLLPSGQAYGYFPLKSDDDIFRLDPWFGLEARARSELQSRAVDRLLGRFVARLRELGRFDDAWVVVTSDHGVLFDTGIYERSTEKEHLAATLSVPLLIKRPGQSAGRRFDHYVELVDVAKTLADDLGFELPCASDGQNLYGADPKSYAESVYAASFGYHDGNLADVESKLRSLSRSHRDILGIDPRPYGTARDEISATSPYGLGPFGALVGSAAPRETGTLPYVAEVPDLESIADFQLDDPLLPARILGRIHGLPEGEHLDLALAVADRIVSTTRSRTLFEEEVFSGIADPEHLRPGTLEVFAVHGPSAEPRFDRLRVIDQETRDRQLLRRAGPEVLRQGGGSGFDELVGTGGLEVLESSPGLRILASTPDPHLLFRTAPLQSKSLVLEIDLTAPQPTDIQIWFQTDELPHLSRQQIRRAPLRRGRNQLVLEIRSDSHLRPDLRLDPGLLQGEYILHSLVVRGGGDDRGETGYETR